MIDAENARFILIWLKGCEALGGLVLQKIRDKVLYTKVSYLGQIALAL